MQNLIHCVQYLLRNCNLCQNKIFINKLLYLIIINSFSKIGNGQVVENLFPKKMNRDLLESHHF